MGADRFIEVFLGLLTLIVGYTSFVMATRTTRIQEKASVRAVDAAAFDRAKQIYEGALDTLRGELVACRADLTTARSDLTTARSEIAGLRIDIAGLKAEIAKLRGRTNGII